MKHTTRMALVVMIVVALAGAARAPAHVSRAQGSGMLLYGSSIFGTVVAGAPSTTYAFDGTVGDLVHVDVKSMSDSLDPAVSLISPDGQTLASSQHHRLSDYVRAAQVAQFLPQSGVYSLAVSGANGTSGEFMLRLQGRSPVSSTALVYEQPVQVTIPLNALPQFFTFEAQNCPTTLTVTNLSDGLPYTFPFVVKVRNRQGRDIALLRGGDAQEDRVTVVPLSGRYEVEVLSDNPAAQGMITLLVSCAERAPGCQPEGAASGEAPAGAEEPVCPACLECPGDWEPGEEAPACPDMALREDFTGPAELTLHWNPVAGAESYRIHVFGIGEEGETHLGSAEELGDAVLFEFRMPDDDLDTWGYRFIVEAIQDGVVICMDEIEVPFTLVDIVPACEDLNLAYTMSSEPEPTVTFTWDEYPGAHHYGIRWRITSLDESEVYAFAGGVIGETTITVHVPDLDPLAARVWFEVEVEIDGDIICAAEQTAEFMPQQVHPVCPDMNFAATVTDPTVRGTTLAWTGVPGTDHYQIHMYGLGEEEAYLGAAGAPGDGTEFVFDHLWMEYPGYRFVIEALGPDGAVICTDEATVNFGGQLLICSETDFTAAIVEHTGTVARLAWSTYPGAENYIFYLLDESGEMVPGYPVLLAATQLGLVLEPAPGTYTAVVGPWAAPDGTICVRELAVVFEGGPVAAVPAESAAVVPCQIRASREDVRVHVGPGRNRSVFTLLPPNRDFTVTGQALDDGGNAWWQVDKTQIPGYEAVISLWVAASDVTASGDCDAVQAAEPPPIIPSGPPAPGVWMPCGSCNTCGHPANECVTSPEGQCLWDPSTCLGGGPQPGGVDQPPPQTQQCFTLGVDVYPANGGSVAVLTASNCTLAATTEGGGGYLARMALQRRGYTPGTVVQVQATPAASCTLKRWDGCGASPFSNPTSFTMNSSCTITAYFVCQ
jgi:hypothetical protein